MFERFRRFMIGRYGPDQLNIALLICGCAFSLLGRLASRWWYLPADVLYLFLLFRFFSRNAAARQRENAFFLRYWQPVKGWFSGLRQRLEDRQRYKYFKCPQCGQRLRAPRGRGTIEVTCQQCRHVFRTKV